MQRPASIEDQVRNCQDAVDRKDWILLTDQLYSDKGVSGQTLDGRDGFKELIELALSGKAPFQGIIADDTSRFGRNTTDILTIVDRIVHAGVFLYFANKNLDSRDPNFRTLLITYAQQDEAHSIQLGEKVHRGMRGRMLKGFLPNGRAYGYRTEEVMSQMARVGARNSMVEGVALVVFEPEAAVVRRIFEMSASGAGTPKIARTLQAEGIPATRSHLTGLPGHWHAQTVKRMIKNPKYKGLHVWNKTTHRNNPFKHKKERVARAESEWERKSNEKWRIVSDDLWEAANEALRTRAKKFPGVRGGGLARWENAETYIFSGLLKCAHCDGFLRIFSNRPNSKRYMCMLALRWGGCDRRQSIVVDTLQERLLSALRVLVEEGLQEALVSRIMTLERDEELRREGLPSVADLKASRLQIKLRLDHIYDNAPQSSFSAVFDSKVDELEKQHALKLQEITSAEAPMRPLISEDEAKALAEVLIGKFRTALQGDKAQVKDAMQLYLQPLQVQWEQRGAERLAILFSGIDFRLGHLKGSVTIPFKAVISADSKLGVLTSEIHDPLSKMQDALTVAECAKLLGRSKTKVYKWCVAGLKHHRVVAPKTRPASGSIRIRPEDLQVWLKKKEPRDNSIELLAPDWRPIVPQVEIKRRKQAFPEVDGLAFAA
jgi:DNA invertase Pin-like site-specific DNA recombinase